MDEEGQRLKQIAEIEATFEAARVVPQHPNPAKRHLTPVAVLPVLPDFDKWPDKFVNVQFDSDPGGHRGEAARLGVGGMTVHDPQAPASHPCVTPCHASCRAGQPPLWAGGVTVGVLLPRWCQTCLLCWCCSPASGNECAELAPLPLEVRRQLLERSMLKTFTAGHDTTKLMALLLPKQVRLVFAAGPAGNGAAMAALVRHRPAGVCCVHCVHPAMLHGVQGASHDTPRPMCIRQEGVQAPWRGFAVTICMQVRCSLLSILQPPHMHSCWSMHSHCM